MSVQSLATDRSLRPKENIARGILYVCAAAVISAFMSVSIKWLSDSYPAVELTFFRCIFGFIPVALIVRRGGGIATLKTRRATAHFLRALAWTASFLTSFLALHFLGLADAVALSFLAPIFMTMLSVPMLGEHVGIHRWSAVCVGFIGIVFMAQPKGEVFQFGTLFGIASAFFWGVGSLSVRQLTHSESTSAITFYTHLFAALILALALPFFWVTPDWQGLLAMLAVGVMGGTSQYWGAQALSYAPAASIAPFNYTQMVWAVILGFLIWQDLPGRNLLIGVALVIASGLYILYREMRRARMAAEAAMR
jgi:drug/metabolite transporter (DMT)-like permease